MNISGNHLSLNSAQISNIDLCKNDDIHEKKEKYADAAIRVEAAIILFTYSNVQKQRMKNKNSLPFQYDEETKNKIDTLYTKSKRCEVEKEFDSDGNEIKGLKGRPLVTHLIRQNINKKIDAMKKKIETNSRAVRRPELLSFSNVSEKENHIRELKKEILELKVKIKEYNKSSYREKLLRIYAHIEHQKLDSAEALKSNLYKETGPYKSELKKLEEKKNKKLTKNLYFGEINYYPIADEYLEENAKLEEKFQDQSIKPSAMMPSYEAATEYALLQRRLNAAFSAKDAMDNNNVSIQENSIDWSTYERPLAEINMDIEKYEEEGLPIEFPKYIENSKKELGEGEILVGQLHCMMTPDIERRKKLAEKEKNIEIKTIDNKRRTNEISLVEYLYQKRKISKTYNERLKYLDSDAYRDSVCQLTRAYSKWKSDSPPSIEKICSDMAENILNESGKDFSTMLRDWKSPDKGRLVMKNNSKIYLLAKEAVDIISGYSKENDNKEEIYSDLYKYLAKNINVLITEEMRMSIDPVIEILNENKTQLMTNKGMSEDEANEYIEFVKSKLLSALILHTTLPIFTGQLSAATKRKKLLDPGPVTKGINQQFSGLQVRQNAQLENLPGLVEEMNANLDNVLAKFNLKNTDSDFESSKKLAIQNDNHSNILEENNLGAVSEKEQKLDEPEQSNGNDIRGRMSLIEEVRQDSLADQGMKDSQPIETNNILPLEKSDAIDGEKNVANNKIADKLSSLVVNASKEEDSKVSNFSEFEKVDEHNLEEKAEVLETGSSTAVDKINEPLIQEAKKNEEQIHEPDANSSEVKGSSDLEKIKKIDAEEVPEINNNLDNVHANPNVGAELNIDARVDSESSKKLAIQNDNHSNILEENNLGAVSEKEQKLDEPEQSNGNDIRGIMPLIKEVRQDSLADQGMKDSQPIEKKKVENNILPLEKSDAIDGENNVASNKITDNLSSLVVNASKEEVSNFSEAEKVDKHNLEEKAEFLETVSWTAVDKINELLIQEAKENEEQIHEPDVNSSEVKGSSDLEPRKKIDLKEVPALVDGVNKNLGNVQAEVNFKPVINIKKPRTVFPKNVSLDLAAENSEIFRNMNELEILVDKKRERLKEEFERAKSKVVNFSDIAANQSYGSSIQKNESKSDNVRNHSKVNSEHFVKKIQRNIPDNQFNQFKRFKTKRMEEFNEICSSINRNPFTVPSENLIRAMKNLSACYIGEKAPKEITEKFIQAFGKCVE